MPKYCITCAVVNGDGRVAFRNLCTALVGKVVGRDQVGGVFQRYVWGIGGVAATVLNAKGESVEVDAVAIVGFNDNVSKQTQDEINDLQQIPGVAQMLFTQDRYDGPSNPLRYMTRAEVHARLRTRAGEDGSSKYWPVEVGANLTTADNAALLAKFGNVV